ncbi:hypothetical protein, partial [Microcoleus sp. A003_D6]|uniref:hypothetical protein n=1 Tax=Microcoleus sp. A003_D6 TaxID=3055266 RepID=UPI002FD34294
QEKLSFVEQASCLFLTGSPARSTRKIKFCGTGILPVPNVPQEKLSFVEQASCLFLTGSPARSTRKLSFVEQASYLFLTKVQEN